MSRSRKKKILLLLIVLVLIGGLVAARHRAFIQTNVTESLGALTLPSEISLTTYSYGSHELEQIDVYSASSTTPAPIIVMVHGGAWFIGDKANENVYKNKLDYWGPQGYMLISVNYPMMYEGYKPDAQAKAIATALTYIQTNTAAWGGDPDKMIVMGHSAGAHLVSLVSANRADYPALMPWSGTVLLDSAAYDLVAIMQSNPANFYQEAFGEDSAYWIANSPQAQLTTAVEPLYVVCSSNRAPSVCAQADVFKNKAIGLHGSAQLRKEPLSHEEINTTLGLPNDYTRAIDAFILRVTQ